MANPNPAPTTIGASSDAADMVKNFKSQLDDAAKKFGPQIDQVKRHLRPWEKFMVLKKPDGSTALNDKVQANLHHFQINYAVVFAVGVIIAIISHPLHIVVSVFVAFLWAAFMQKNLADPNWKPKVGPVELTVMHCWTGLATVSLVLTLLVAGEALVRVLGVCGALSLGHAALHPGASAVGEPPIPAPTTEEQPTIEEQQSAAAAAAAAGRQAEYELKMHSRLAQSRRAQFRGKCNKFMPGPGAAGSCILANKWHFWVCHGCQTAQFWGSCINKCDWSATGWTCLNHECEGAICGCHKGQEYWRDHGRDWVQS